MFDQAYLDKVRTRIRELESQMSDPSISANRKRFQEAMGEHRRQKELETHLDRLLSLKRTTEESEAMLATESDAELRAMAQADRDAALAALPAAEKAATFALLPADVLDQRSVIMEIRGGTGGEEAALFAANLYRMYQRYAESRGWKVTVLDCAQAEKGGYKEIVFEIEGDGVYRWMKFESGTHRVQRVPATEAHQYRHCRRSRRSRRHRRRNRDQAGRSPHRHLPILRRGRPARQ
jgi:peptide chain release factor 1